MTLAHLILPPELVTIEKWRAFKGKYPSGSDIEHRIIIVYRDENEKKLHYFYVTSKVKEARKKARDDIGSFVCINSSDWPVLTKESCIQCNEKHKDTVDEGEFMQDYAAGKIEILGEVPEVVKKAIIRAVCASISFTDAEKAKYTV
jgi:hypothetical protein